MMKCELLEGGFKPTQRNKYSAGFDLFTPTDLSLSKGTHIIKMAIKFELPYGTYCSIQSLSYLMEHGVFVENTIVNEDERKEVEVVLRLDKPFECKRGQVIAQAVIKPRMIPLISVHKVNPIRRL